MLPEQLASILPCPIHRAIAWCGELNAAMAVYGIDTPPRQAAFIAQVAHESGGLQYTREIWGPTLQQKRYERDFSAAWPPTPADQINRLAFGLGNEYEGDGKKFRGYGLIQITGRSNLTEMGDDLELPLSERPELLELPTNAAMSAGCFWLKHGLNSFADRGDFDGVSDVINRGHKTLKEGDAIGYQDRVGIWKRACLILKAS